MEWKKVDLNVVDLEGPFECPECGGHIMLDATFLEQVSGKTPCPYCKAKNKVTIEN